ncbi:HD domain-containing protein, partial [Candidatus Babeliales bacterium]|nr:HD domain-containing protein [Candidatus Babeliales bacterium]
MDIVEQITNRAKEYFSNSKGSHDWEHTLRVYNLCLHIGEKENADMETLKIAAILHDIGREHQDKCNGKVCHAEKGAELSRVLLSKFKISKEKVDNIVHCIQTHRFRGSNVPTSKEAKILFDADKLDSIGAVGIGRAFLFAGEIGAKLHNKETDIDKTEA